MNLQFPKDQIVGQLDWAGAWSAGGDGPVLAVGSIDVPDSEDIGLDVTPLLGRKPATEGSWQLVPDTSSPGVDLAFLAALPPDVITSLSLSRVQSENFSAVRHLAPGLRRLYLPSSGLGDDVLPDVAALTNLTYLQTFGNQFTDAGVQVLGALQNLRSLYLEEETLTIAGFDFVADLPHLERLGLQDVPLKKSELAELRRRLPHTRVGQ